MRQHQPCSSRSVCTWPSHTSGTPSRCVWSAVSRRPPSTVARPSSRPSSRTRPAASTTKSGCRSRPAAARLSAASRTRSLPGSRSSCACRGTKRTPARSAASRTERSSRSRGHVVGVGSLRRAHLGEQERHAVAVGEGEGRPRLEGRVRLHLVLDAEGAQEGHHRGHERLAHDQGRPLAAVEERDARRPRGRGRRRAQHRRARLPGSPRSGSRPAAWAATVPVDAATGDEEGTSAASRGCTPPASAGGLPRRRSRRPRPACRERSSPKHCASCRTGPASASSS